jgi:arylsulfatase A-like enzyme
VNFILFNPDELRAESAYLPAVAPNLDALSAQGTRFTSCHTQHPVCTPSRCSFMTGLPPHVHGHRTLWHLLRPHEPNLLRYLKEAGYEVVWGGKNDLLSPESVPLSADDWHLERRSTRAVRRQKVGQNPFAPDDPRYHSFLYEPTGAPHEATADFAWVDGAIQYLKSGPKQPFCLYLPLVFPHCPYYAPPGFHDRFRPDEAPPLRPVITQGKPDFHRLIRETRRLDACDEALFRQLHAVYLGMIAYSDYLLGMLLQTLSETGLADDTAVFAFSDHGDWAGDYGLVEKWPSALDDTITRVPFVVRIPGGQAGHVVPTPIELSDLFGTVMDLSGIEARHTHFSRSLVPQLHGAPGDASRTVFAEGGYARHEPRCFEGRADSDGIFRDPTHIYYPKGRLQQTHPQSVCRASMARTTTHKLIYRPDGLSELYDLQADPHELTNRYEDSALAPARSALERELLDWYVQTADTTPFQEDPRGFVG